MCLDFFVEFLKLASVKYSAKYEWVPEVDAGGAGEAEHEDEGFSVGAEQ